MSESPYVKDPLNPTDAELSAAIERGIESGQLLTFDHLKEFAEGRGALVEVEDADICPDCGESLDWTGEADTSPEAEAGF
ncbi:MAG TPA: hypothetical protein VGG75_14875 [Trebonia sp.]|jgi:hypothetical protein